MVIELQVIAGAGFRSPRPKSVGLGQNLPGHDADGNCHQTNLSPKGVTRFASLAPMRPPAPLSLDVRIRRFMALIAYATASSAPDSSATGDRWSVWCHPTSDRSGCGG